ncbi:MAG: DUF4215 domain-containing protein [Myxococcota bacterium]
MSMLMGLLMALAVGREADAAPTIDPLDIQGLELADGQMMPRPPVVAWGRAKMGPNAGLDRMQHEQGRIWASWDPARQHPGGIMTTGIPAPGTIASATRAADFTREFLGRYVDVLAPGSSIDDFVVVSNDLSSGIRTVGLVQHMGGVPVLGGQMSVRIKADRLIYVASQALPNVDTSQHTGSPLPPAQALTSAQAFIEGDYPGVKLSASGLEGPFILPIWGGTAWSYHEVVRVTVDATEPLGRWAVYVDASTGAPVAREQQMRSVATVRYNIPERYPLSTRYDAAAPGADVFENGMGSVTNLDGEVAVNNSPTDLTVTVNGPLVDVVNQAGPEAQATFPVVDGGTLVWNESDSQFVDAQISAFVHTALVKEHVRGLDPTLAWLDGTIQVNVNINGQCNASSNGDSINFLQGGGSCENTARLADVVYHEVGHSVHFQSLIDGVGQFEGALSEGISDYLAATIVDDSGMGRGFTYDNEPLRELNPEGFEWTWPMDKGEVHFEGQIIGGTLWDLRTLLISTLGDELGRYHTDMIYYEGHRRAVDIPTMYPEALVYDDDDGDLSNGTPNICEINDAFEAHGLLDLGEFGGFEVDFSQVFEGGEVVVVSSLPMLAGCPLDLSDAILRWRVRGDDTTGEEVPMALADGAWTGIIPPQDSGVVVEYQVEMTYASGEEVRYPLNDADPWYQGFFGAVTPIYCFDENADPAEWVFSGPGNNWNFGPLMEGPNDPSEPYDEDGALINQEGQYPAGSDSEAIGPVVDISDSLDVRLHYRRWLTVEDGQYDQARIRVNGQTRWSNLFTGQGTTHHVDREWRFQDLPLGDFLDDGQVQLEFQLDSDGGLEFGGWTIDGLCVVEVVPAVCGDGQVSGDEECDDGNTEDGDGCSAQCESEEPDPGTTGGEDEDSGDSMDGTSGGNGSVDETGGSVPGDDTSPDDDGSTGGDAGQDDGGAVDDGCGCTTTPSEQPLRGAWLLLLAAGMLRRRRR